MGEAAGNKASATVGTTGELRQLGAGTTLGRYTLLRRIASGGMAEVYAARSQGISGFEKKVAIKKILPQYSLNHRFIDMLVDEAKITVSLTHPNIAQVYELGLEGDTYYIVMEYVDGRPLNRLLQKIDARGHRTIPIEHSVHIMVEVTKGLHHAHHQRDARGEPLSIVHRDISPQNVLLAYTGDVKLIDFGIARAQGRAAQTSVGVIKGKLRYLAPEIALGQEPDHRADIFCCGIVLFELLTGEAMFAPRTDVEAIEMASKAMVRSPRLSNPDVPEELEEIVMRALARDREERYQTAKAFYTDLRRFLNQYFPAYVGSELGDYMQSLFVAEVEEERRLDALAEKVIEDGKKRAEATQPGALAPLEVSADEHRPGYQQIVTRAGIDLAPRAPADDEDDDEMPGTAVTVPGHQPAEREHSNGRAKTAPVLIVPDLSELHRDRDEGAPLLDAGAHPSTEEHSTGTRVPNPYEATHRTGAPISPRERPGLQLGARALVLAVPVLLAGGLWALAERGPDEALAPAGPETAVQGAVQQPELPVIGERAFLTLEISPSVPVDVEVEGVPKVQSARPPVKLEIPARSTPQRIVVRAPGHHPKEVSRLLAPGNESLVTLVLEPITGTIVLEGAEDGQITADAGRVQGAEITGIPLGSRVRVRVTRPNARPWTETVELRSGEPLVLEVPKASPVPKGTLVVNSRPFSEVYVNDRLRGSTPLSLKLDPSTYKITLKRPDGQTYTRRETIRSGKRISVVHQWPR